MPCFMLHTEHRTLNSYIFSPVRLRLFLTKSIIIMNTGLSVNAVAKTVDFSHCKSFTSNLRHNILFSEWRVIKVSHNFPLSHSYRDCLVVDFWQYETWRSRKRAGSHFLSGVMLARSSAPSWVNQFLKYPWPWVPSLELVVWWNGAGELSAALIEEGIEKRGWQQKWKIELRNKSRGSTMCTIHI